MITHAQPNFINAASYKTNDLLAKAAATPLGVGPDNVCWIASRLLELPTQLRTRNSKNELQQNLHLAHLQEALSQYLHPTPPSGIVLALSPIDRLEQDREYLIRCTQAALANLQNEVTDLAELV